MCEAAYTDGRGGVKDLKALVEDVRSDTSSTNWVLITYDEDTPKLESGESLEDMAELFNNSETAFVYLRLETGDEMSKRKKFALVQRIKTDIKPLKKGKMSFEKERIKKICKVVAVEDTTDEDFSLTKVLEKAKAAGGANYGTG